MVDGPIYLQHPANRTQGTFAFNMFNFVNLWSDKYVEAIAKGKHPNLSFDPIATFTYNPVSGYKERKLIPRVNMETGKIEWIEPSYGSDFINFKYMATGEAAGNPNKFVALKNEFLKRTGRKDTTLDAEFLKRGRINI